MTPTRIIVFAKAPQPGRVKTRLIPALGAHGAAQLAAQMLNRTLEAALDAAIGPVTLSTEPEPNTPDWCQIALPDGGDTCWQGHGDLGARMARAARSAIANGEQIILSGTDCAEISAVLFRDAAQQLAQVDVGLYPSVDGGYVLLAMRRYHPTLFSNIAWSTSTVAATTMQRLQALGWRVHTGPLLHDIDTPDDLPLWNTK